MGYKEDPFLFFDDKDEAFTEIQKYFELKQVIWTAFHEFKYIQWGSEYCAVS